MHKDREASDSSHSSALELQRLFESFTLVLAAVGMIECGFFYATLLSYVIQTVAFAEMIKL